MWRFSLVVAVLGACTTPNPRSCLDDFCENPDLPFCDSDGVVSGEPGTCVAVDCEPLTFEACRGDEAVICNATGDNYNVTNCANGCVAEMGCAPCEIGSPGCTPQIIPKFLPTICNSVSLLPDYVISQSTQLDTTNETTCTGGVFPQTGGPEICVIRAPTISLAAGIELKVTGTRAIAFVADKTVTFEGDVDVSADGILSGPGGDRPSGTNTFGAGFDTRGAMGGGLGMLGAAIPDPAEGDIFIAGGRSTSENLKLYATGGGGGGGLLIVSCQDTVQINGLIDASGGGGNGGRFGSDLDMKRQHGGGGGSGGYVVVQGMRIELTGSIFANGGGGGGGGGLTLNGVAGQDGILSRMFTSNGGASPEAGAGGYGGLENYVPSDGVVPSNTNVRSGGGGGSAGMIQLFTPANVPPATLGATVSPDFQPHRTVETK